MKCPTCETEMESGYSKVHGTVGGFLMFGFSHQHLWFKGKGDKEMIVPSNDEVDAFRCKDCDVTVLKGESHTTQRYMNLGKSLGEKYGKWKHGKNS